MLFSEESLTGTGQILHKCLGKIWEVRRISSHMGWHCGKFASCLTWLAFSQAVLHCTQAKYIPSADMELRETGQKTKIEYSKDFCRFKAFIVYKSREKWMQDTLAFIYRHVFVGINGPVTQAEQGGHDYDEEYAIMMEEFNHSDLSDNKEGSTALPQLPLVPPQPPSYQNQWPIQNGIAGPLVPRAHRGAPPAELDAIRPPAQDTTGDREDTSPVLNAARQTKGNSRKAKGKGKA
jgi:hypothetical protein